MAHKLPPLRFGYDALEPYIDAETMELHHDKHHKAYVDNLNKARELYPQLAELHGRGPAAWWNVIAWDVVDEQRRDVMTETGGTLCRDTSRPSS